MNPATLRKSLLPLALLILFLAACSDDDDPVSPGTPLWQEVDLGAAPPSQMLSITHKYHA